MREYDVAADMTTFFGYPAYDTAGEVIALVSTNYGTLVPEDELLTHQMVDTFASVANRIRHGRRRSGPWRTPATTPCRRPRNGQVHQPGRFRRRRGCLSGQRAMDRTGGTAVVVGPLGTPTWGRSTTTCRTADAIRWPSTLPNMRPSRSTSCCRADSREHWKIRGQTAVPTATASRITSCGITRSVWRQAGWTWGATAPNSVLTNGSQ